MIRSPPCSRYRQLGEIGGKRVKDYSRWAKNTPWAWADAGGELGLSGDWVQALRPENFTSGGNGTTGSGNELVGMSIRGDHCSSEPSRTRVQRILHRRNRERSNNKVLYTAFLCTPTEVRQREPLPPVGLRRDARSTVFLHPLFAEGSRTCVC